MVDVVDARGRCGRIVSATTGMLAGWTSRCRQPSARPAELVADRARMDRPGLGVSARTVRRDVDPLRALVTAAGATIEAIAGRTRRVRRHPGCAHRRHDQPSSRLVDPYRQVFLRDNWYLLGFDVDHNWRTFRLDRFHDVERVAGNGLQ